MKFIRLFIFALAIAIASPSYAFNYSFLKDTPISNFNAEDIELLQGVLEQSLNEAPDGKITKWRSEKTPAKGTVRVIKTRMKNGKKCRTIQVNNYFKTLHGGMRVELCHQPDETWKVEY
jgi:hypothetical protein